MKSIIITILIYSFIITIVDIIKDSSSYSFGLDGAIDIVVAGPCMWLLMLIIVIIRPIYSKYRKKYPKTKKKYSEKEIKKTVQRFIQMYQRVHKKRDEPLWVIKEGYFENLYFDVYRPSELKLRKMVLEPLEKKYHIMCYDYSDIVWEELKKYGKSITESEDWETFQENSWKSDIEKLLQHEAIELF